jgi:hypothetical protein
MQSCRCSACRCVASQRASLITPLLLLHSQLEEASKKADEAAAKVEEAAKKADEQQAKLDELAKKVEQQVIDWGDIPHDHSAAQLAGWLPCNPDHVQSRCGCTESESHAS